MLHGGHTQARENLSVGFLTSRVEVQAEVGIRTDHGLNLVGELHPVQQCCRRYRDSGSENR
jgi:hypothetical protein